MDYRYGKLVANDELVLLLRGADMTKYGSDIGARMRGYVHYFLTVQLGNSFVTRELEQIKKQTGGAA